MTEVRKKRAERLYLLFGAAMAVVLAGVVAMTVGFWDDIARTMKFQRRAQEVGYKWAFMEEAVLGMRSHHRLCEAVTLECAATAAERTGVPVAWIADSHPAVKELGGVSWGLLSESTASATQILLVEPRASVSIVTKGVGARRYVDPAAPFYTNDTLLATETVGTVTVTVYAVRPFAADPPSSLLRFSWRQSSVVYHLFVDRNDDYVDVGVAPPREEVVSYLRLIEGMHYADPHRAREVPPKEA